MLTQEATPERKWLSVPEAATYTGYGVDTIRDAAANGEIECGRRPTEKGRGSYRFTPAALDAWLESGQRTPARPERQQARRERLARDGAA
jgi:excisionase family DNA binding protein